MTDTARTFRTSPTGARVGAPLPPGPLLGFVIAFSAVALIALLTYASLQTRATAARRVTSTLAIDDELQSILSLVKDAETGQRGYLLTGEESYLEPYTSAKAAMANELDTARSLLSSEGEQMRRLASLHQVIEAKMAELAQTIAMRRAGDTAGALAIVRTDRGKMVMDRIRALVAQMQVSERNELAGREADWQHAESVSSAVTFGGSALLLFLIAAAALMTSRDYRARQIQGWLRTGQMGLSTRIQGEHRLERLGDLVLGYLAEYLDAQVGALYIAEDDGTFRRVAGYANVAAADRQVVRSGDGLLGQAAKELRPLHVRNVPAGYLPIGSALGRGEPAELLISPALVDGTVHAIVELGFLHRVQPEEMELLSRLSETLAIAIRTSKDRTRLEQLLQETQSQGEELQAQQEELRVSNEELEVQARSLKESQVQLEEQQAELEQTNSQLEEQAQILEHQKLELSNAQAVTAQKAADLERANQYKSEFLANMSHELRTPLNSSLILAKLLADNRSGNLSAEQVKFAQTISSAGNDLLAIINDILDLSKIEAGKIELNVQTVIIASTLDTLVKTFQPVAEHKGVTFSARIDADAPDRLQTDPQRVGQILKNLISNALKFTREGAVSVRVFAGSEDTVCFAVEDTGIGIPEHQQAIIFEAFRQADGSTHRKYGGTGLGLTISRDLARLLGGDIAVESVSGKGSIFTLTLPTSLEADASVSNTGAAAGRGSRGDAGAGIRAVAGSGTVVGAAALAGAGTNASADVASGATPSVDTVAGPGSRAAAARLRSLALRHAARATGAVTVEDDAQRLKADSRVILIVDDDTAFATILRDVAHESGFQCVVAHTASDALAAVATYRPKAILLDMHLPDNSGMSVLDQLKRNPDTRHIPVHVISVADYSQEALAMGAVGYALKPVRREQLVEALQRLEAQFAQRVRQVLVIEDDERQRESIRQLLQHGEVRITAARNAGEALDQLRRATFDCVVMDLNLPDFSGYELLQQMAEEEEVSFPPVIIYTGRSLTRDEEQALHRFSRSIIIKDARSPERLLDEVTLFLHQVESKLPIESQRMLQAARDRDAALENRRILIVEDDVRNIFALSSLLEPKGAKIEIARNGHEALEALTRGTAEAGKPIDLVLMDIMMPEMDGLTAMREIRKQPAWKKLPIIALTAKAMKDDQERCLAAGANDYIAKPLDVEKLLSLVRVWMPK